MFYFDGNLKRYEKECSWDKALVYLENLFAKQYNIQILNSLIGFSWYYLIEGPVDSGRFEEDDNHIALIVWKKYLEIGINNYKTDYSFCLIAGYTLLMHGFYIDEYRKNSELIALQMLKYAMNASDLNIKEFSKCILKLQQQKRYKPIKLHQEVFNALFYNDSLLENYFRHLYG